MNAPRIEVDLSKIRHNTQNVVQQLKACGIDATGVTKAVCGHPAIAHAMLDGGVSGLAESRVANVKRLRKAGITSPITLIRTPMLSQADEVVELCEASYNTEVVVIAALAAAAIHRDKVHGIILMVEMGDLRDGILPENLPDVAEQVMKIPGVALKGIGTNFACLNGAVPTATDMEALSLLATEIEGLCGPFIQTVSGGNSANLLWAFGGEPTGRINDLRLGEAILLGVDPVSGTQLEGLFNDAFVLVAEIIETDTKPASGPDLLVEPSQPKLCIVSNSDDASRVILAIGKQDTDILGLTMPKGGILIGATSDHLIIGMNQSALQVGAELRFQMNYSALMHAMAAPDVELTLLNDRPSRRSRKKGSMFEHLALV